MSKLTEPLQAVVILVTLAGVLGGGAMAFGVLKSVVEGNRDDLIDFRTQWNAAWSDQKNVLRDIDQRMRTNEIQLAELRAILHGLESPKDKGHAGGK